MAVSGWLGIGRSPADVLAYANHSHYSPKVDSPFCSAMKDRIHALLAVIAFTLVVTLVWIVIPV